MDGIVRRLKINELRTRILLHELEHAALIRELRTSGTSNQRRAEIYRRRPRLKFEHIEALNDLRWLEAEERLRRPDRATLISAIEQRAESLARAKPSPNKPLRNPCAFTHSPAAARGTRD